MPSAWCGWPAFLRCPPGCPGQRGREDTGWNAPAPSLTQALAPAHEAGLPPARSRGEWGGESTPAVHPSREAGLGQKGQRWS